MRLVGTCGVGPSEGNDSWDTASAKGGALPEHFIPTALR
jgi:hypothetical protein